MYCWIRRCQNADSADSDCFTADILCQHGETECHENTVEGCVIKYYPEPSQHVPFLECYEGQGVTDTDDKLIKCAHASNMDESKINTCATGSEGHELLIMNAKKTLTLGKSKLGTPWIIVNGKVLDDPEQLLHAICEAYTGPKPDKCQNLPIILAKKNITALQ